METDINPALIALAIQEVPTLIDLIRARFAHANPDAVPPTDEEVIAAYQSALASSLAKDAAWLEAHPET